ncbi:GIY-YIG nuclease family protein [Streptomyces sp. S1D4-14]|jgi:hypothetical protein|uniref:GIY-YIG nuclease family protein n=1 Tax=Streptomyces sp. S1D4-14 TaxID=2594461 RepID=UPI001164FF32|nr:GIY-YIG nuclease family protein [Streptomyces sp. S1D4-14]
MTSDTAGQVYVIGSPGSRIAKIGYSKAPEKRLWFLQVGSPDELLLLATFEGGQDLEAALHRYFRAYHRRGEWFELGDDPVETVRAAVDLGIPGLLAAVRPAEDPRSVRSSAVSATSMYRSVVGLDWNVRFPPLPRWRAQALLAAHGIAGAAHEGVSHSCDGCADCLAHFPQRLALRPHPA